MTRIGEILLDAGLITASELEEARALKVQQARLGFDLFLGEALVVVANITPQQVEWALIKQRKARASQTKTDLALEGATRALEEMRTAALAV